MARHVAGPWFRKSKNAWYVTYEGRTVSLGVGGKGSCKEAVEAWHRLLREGPKQKVAEKTRQTVADAMTDFLSDAAARIKPIPSDT